MTANEFEVLKQIFRRTFVGKLKVVKRDSVMRYSVANINEKTGIVTLDTPLGFDFAKYQYIKFPISKHVLENNSVQDIADMLNRNESV